MASKVNEIAGLTCRCGHVKGAHEHYRRGSECSLCPPGACGHFKAIARRATVADASAVAPDSCGQVPASQAT